MVLVMGEITTSARIDIAQIARKAICDAGYDRPEMGFDGHSCNVMVAMGRQSPDIAMASTTPMTTARPARAIRA